MPIGPEGENLIFVLSMQRSGSTLLQRMLATHPAVQTCSEPWIMLHPFYALRREGFTASYNQEWAVLGLEQLVQLLPGGMDDYHEAVRRMYSYLYTRALGEDSGKTHFLDKTPRYYLIIPELVKTFPGASFILLYRNPLAVLSSLITSWCPDGKYHHLTKWATDMNEAPRRLIEAGQLLGGRALRIKYEDMVARPEEHMEAICRHVGLDYAPGMSEYGRKQMPVWALGDKKSVYSKSRPDASHADKWMDVLKDAQVWRVSREYLDQLGPDTVRSLGYDFESLHQILEDRRPSSLRLIGTCSLRWLQIEARHKRLKHGYLFWAHMVRTHGWLRTMRWFFMRCYNRYLRPRSSAQADATKPADAAPSRSVESA